MKKIPLHWKILGGMALGLLAGVILSRIGGGSEFVRDWIKPFGTIFINLLKLIAIPLIIASLIKGIADLQDISKFSSLGLKTISIYIFTTLIALTIGLVVVYAINPGDSISAETLSELVAENTDKANTRIEAAKGQKQMSPIQFLVDMVPDNIFAAASGNGNMLKVIFFVIFFGISLLLIPAKEAEPLKKFFNSLNEVILKMVDLIMLYAPIGVFALMAALIVETTNPDLFVALAKYAMAVVIGLVLMLVLYVIVVSVYIGKSPMTFLKGIAPAQLVAFSTSSSAATLPVTMERVEEHLGVQKEVVSFVCPVGATINMDGTSLYQAIATVFICEAFNFDLTWGALLTILFTALLASIGTAAVPGAGVVMLIIVLEAVNFPSEYLALGIAMILAVDRPLDMLRTVINITGDATVSMIVGKNFGKLQTPNPKNWDDVKENF